MALVAYDNSDSSEFEEEEDDKSTVVTLNKKIEEPSPSVSKLFKKEDESITDTKLFNLLPQPSHKKPEVIEEDDEFLHKKEDANIIKPKAKITVPSLSDFKDVENRPSNKPKTANGKKSGLLSMLPQPKNVVTKTTKSLIPHILTQKPATAKKKEPLPSPMKKSKTESKPLVTDYSDESDNDDEVQNDFFSFNKKEEVLPEVPLDLEPLETAHQVQKIPRSIESYFKKDEGQNHMELQPDYVEAGSSMEEYQNVESSTYNGSSSNGYPESSSGDVLDEEAILKLCGTRGKRKREEIQIVDVNQEEVLADAREWLVKGLMNDTSKRVSVSKKRGNEPTSQQKRKHQITYLAHQAKANEAELQNQWANSRVSRRQTQSKYGF